ncbi:hypothetical protein TNCV_5129571 [Trichonephila clavipes]|nr:hypothetical protein TNCV_5129571 [Trichonephila clavipes]
MPSLAAKNDSNPVRHRVELSLADKGKQIGPSASSLCHPLSIIMVGMQGLSTLSETHDQMFSASEIIEDQAGQDINRPLS